MPSLATSKPACTLALLLAACHRPPEAITGGAFACDERAAPAAEARAAIEAAPEQCPPHPAVEIRRSEAAPEAGTRIVAAASSDALRVVGDLLPGLQVIPTESSDRGAIELVLLDKVEAAFVARPTSGNEKDAGACEQVLGWQVPVLVVHPSNPIRSISRFDVREILSARVTGWARLGGPLSKVMLLAPPPGETADRYAALLMPGDRFARSARGIASSAARLQACAEDPAAVAVVDLTDVQERTDVKLISLDGTPPSAPAVAERRYPAGCAIRVVWKRRTARVESLLRELRSPAWSVPAAGRLTL